MGRDNVSSDVRIHSSRAGSFNNAETSSETGIHLSSNKPKKFVEPTEFFADPTLITDKGPRRSSISKGMLRTNAGRYGIYRYSHSHTEKNADKDKHEHNEGIWLCWSHSCIMYMMLSFFALPSQVFGIQTEWLEFTAIRIDTCVRCGLMCASVCMGTGWSTLKLFAFHLGCQF